jgi:hypothetical protein
MAFFNKAPWAIWNVYIVFRHFDDIPEERVTRYMYNPRSGKWKTDEIVVKMQSQVFVSPHIVGIPEILINSHQASESAYNQTYYAMPSSL